MRASAAARTLALLLGGVGLPLVLVLWSERPPAPRSADAAPAEFSEARAMRVVSHLVDSIGARITGTPGRDAAARYLVGALGAIPGVEVDVQQVAGTRPHPILPHQVVWYDVRNVLARIPGDSGSAVLVSAHYDAPPGSVGAGDDAVSVGAVVETARALAAGPRLRHTVILNLNDGEEAGLLGSSGFVKHPWIRDVRAFINLESAGPGGKSILFQAGPGNFWLLDAYARSAPHPYGTVVAQDIFQSGAIPSDTDFRVYRDDAALRGLDIALFEDGYAYHTELDRVERVEPGAVQHMGANLLAVVRELASGELPGDVGREPGVYYDLLGLVMIAYPLPVARLLAVLALLLAAGAVAFVVRRTPVSVRQVLAAAGFLSLGLLAGLMAAVLGALAPGFLLGRPHGWFATPWLGVVAFGALALAGVLAACAVWERRAARRGVPDGPRELAIWAAGLSLWAVLLTLLTALGAGSAYLALWWVVPAAAGLVLRTLRPGWRWGALVLAFVPGAVVTTQVGTLLLKLFVPLAGRLPAPFPLDPAIAVLVALPVLALGILGAVGIRRVARFPLAASALAVLGVAGLLALTVRFPYTPERPKRIWVEHNEDMREARLLVHSFDALDVSAVLARSPRLVAGLAPSETAPTAFEGSAEPVGIPVPRVEAVGSRYDGAADLRTVTLRVSGESPYLRTLEFPRERLAGWSLTERLPELPDSADSYVAVAVAPPRSGWEMTLRVRGRAPLPVSITEMHTPAVTPTARQVLASLPPWSTAVSSSSRTHDVEL